MVPSSVPNTAAQGPHPTTSHGGGAVSSGPLGLGGGLQPKVGKLDYKRQLLFGTPVSPAHKAKRMKTLHAEKDKRIAELNAQIESLKEQLKGKDKAQIKGKEKANNLFNTTVDVSKPHQTITNHANGGGGRDACP